MLATNLTVLLFSVLPLVETAQVAGSISETRIIAPYLLSFYKKKKTYIHHSGSGFTDRSLQSDRDQLLTLIEGSEVVFFSFLLDLFSCICDIA